MFHTQKDIISNILHYLPNRDKLHFIMGDTMLYSMYNNLLDPSERNCMPVAWAICRDNACLLERFLKDKRMYFTEYISIRNCIEWASRRHNVLSILLRDPRVDHAQFINWAIYNSALYNNIESVTKLLQDSRVQSSSLNKSLLSASISGNTEMIKILLQDDRADPSIDNNQCIIYASMYNRELALQALLQDSRVNPSDQNNKALFSAIHSGYNNIVDILIKDRRFS